VNLPRKVFSQRQVLQATGKSQEV